MNLQAWGFSPSATERDLERREDVKLAIIIGSSFLISTAIAIWIIVGSIISPPKFSMERPLPEIRWEIPRG